MINFISIISETVNAFIDKFTLESYIFVKKNKNNYLDSLNSEVKKKIYLYYFSLS